MYDIIIIGSGPSGLTAAVYTARASLKTLVLAGKKWGGQLMLTTDVENFPGFPEGIQGPQLMMNMRKQAERFGAEFVDKDAVKVDLSKKPSEVFSDGVSYKAKSVIIATGADTRWLGVPGEDKLIGKGVSSCAPCDAFFYKDKKVVVVGGGDSAMEEAQILTKFAKEVIIIHRRNEFRASQIMQNKIFQNPKIKIIWNTEVVEILGDKKVEKVRLRKLSRSENSVDQTNKQFKDSDLSDNLKNRNTDTQSSSDLPAGKAGFSEMAVDGVFVAIGYIPNSSIFKGVVDLDEKNYVKRISHTSSKYPTMSSVVGVFVAGDVWDFRYRQAVTAAGFGCQAALDAERWLEENK